MTRFKLTTLTTLTTMLIAGAALAQAPKDEAKPKMPPTAGAPAIAPPVPVKPPEPPPELLPPPKELTDLVTAAKGSWKCKGFVMQPDGSSRPSVSTLKVSLSSELDKYWVEWVMAEKKTKANPHPMKFHSFRTYDAYSKMWTNVQLDNMGGVNRSTSKDALGGKITFTGAMESGAMKVPTHDFEEMPTKKELHVWGEFAFDGKTFMKGYDVTCTK